MACKQERWCFNVVCAKNGRQMLLLALFLFSVGSLATAESDLYYNYDISEGRSLINDRTSSIKLIEGDEAATRKRRATSDIAVMVTEEKNDSKQQQSQSQSQQQPSVSPSMLNSTTNSTSTVNVHYSTTNSNVNGTTTITPTTETIDSASGKPDLKRKNSTITTVTPSPIYNTSTVLPHVWANRTKWINVTTTNSNKESDNKNQTKMTELTPVKETTTISDEEKSDTDVGDISISKFSENITNSTLEKNNITKTIYDTHQYYNSTFIINADVCKKYWIDLDNHPGLRINHLLSKSHRRATTVNLKFDFPFYGHKIRNITIATGGFLYTGEYVHSWLAATQYIAPLMANFDTRLSNSSFVKYADNGTAFTVEWENVLLQDKPEAGAFTFQVTLHQNGDIVFVYSVIPLVVEQIEDTMHPVKVGLSDAYIMDRTVFFVRRKTIYEYHRVNFNRQDIMNCTVIYLRALPTCLGIDNCRECITTVPSFDCKWCPELNQCSTGTFRLRQEWLVKGCDAHSIKEANKCPAQITTYKGEEYDHDGRIHPGESTAKEMSVKQERPGSSPLESTQENMNMSVSGIIGILTVIGLVMGLAGWGAYAYRNPHSASGQILIRYRPSQWSWRRGEARYTAATIHM